MSHEYAISRVKDALEKSGGNHLKAQRLVLSWLEKDQTLLSGLVSPHIQSIVTHAIAHVMKPPKKISLKDQKAGEFSNSLLESLSGKTGNTGTFGEASPKGLSRPGQASKAHVDAINTLVNAAKSKVRKTKK